MAPKPASPPPASAPLGAAEVRLWFAALAVLTVAALAPIWAFRFPPMQDYPYHLLQTKVLFAPADSGLRAYYDARLNPTYAAFFVITGALSKVMPIEAAGKVFLSICVLMATGLCEAVRRRRGDPAAWGALLFFPLIFNQAWYFGFTNILFALPVMSFALLYHPDAAVSDRSWPKIRQALLLVLLVLSHPLITASYIGTATVWTAAYAPLRRRWARSLLYPIDAAIVLAALLVYWRLTGGSGGFSADTPAWSEILWLSPIRKLWHCLYPFTDMWRPDRGGWATLAVWIAIGVVVGWTLRTPLRDKDVMPRRLTFGLLLVFPLLIFLPFRVGPVGAVPLRASVIYYYLTALTVSQLRFTGWRRLALPALALAALIGPFVKHYNLSNETAEIVPLIERMKPGARVLPICFDRRSRFLDPDILVMHTNDPCYYNIRTDGGLNPRLLPSDNHPMRLAGKWNELPRWLPPFSRPELLDLRLVEFYDYFLVRGRPEGDFLAARDKVRLIEQSGRWRLYETRTPTD